MTYQRQMVIWIGQERPETEPLRRQLETAGIRLQFVNSLDALGRQDGELSADAIVVGSGTSEKAVVDFKQMDVASGIPIIRIGGSFSFGAPENGSDAIAPINRPEEFAALVQLIGRQRPVAHHPEVHADIAQDENDKLRAEVAACNQLVSDASEAESRWRRILDFNPAAICVLQGRRMVYWNRAADRLLDLSGAVGQRRAFVQALMDPKHMDHWAEAVAQGDSSGSVVRTEVRLDNPSFPHRILSVDLLPIDFRGESSWLLYVMDVTEGRVETNAIAQREADYRALFDESPVPMFIQDFSKALEMVSALTCPPTELGVYLRCHPDVVDALTHRVFFTRMNTAAGNLFNLEFNNRDLNSMDQVLLDQDRDHFIDQIVIFSGGGRQYDGQARNRMAGGQVRHLLIRKVVLPDRQNGFSRVLASLVDVTEQYRTTTEMKALESQLRQTQKMEALGTLASGIAHDFNNILTPILGHAELMMYQIPDDSPYRRNLDEICTSADRARSLVRQILSFSRRTEFSIKPLSVQPIIEEVGRLIRSTLPRSIAIDYSVESHSGKIMADPTHLHQVLMNLTTNAFHAMQSQGGTLTLGLREVTIPVTAGAIHHLKPGTYVCLSVADTGIGMDAATVENIFTPYFTTKDQDEGTGLGLAVVHNIVRSYQGEIVVQSMEGKGTAVDVYFPKMIDLSPEEEAGEVGGVHGGRENILVVDDEESIVVILDQVLTRYGYHVTAFSDAAAALNAFSQDPEAYQMLITDLSMPRLTGDQLARRMKATRPDLPVIMLTGYGTPVLEDAAAFPEIDFLLMKPVFAKELASAVRDVLDGHMPEAGVKLKAV